MWNNIKFIFLTSLFCSSLVWSQTISEKKASLDGTGTDSGPYLQESLLQINDEIQQEKDDLQRLYNEVHQLFERGSPPESYQTLLKEVNHSREKIRQLESSWREIATQQDREDYALWHQPEATLGQMIIDYGSMDYVYMMTPEIAAININVSSNLPIPRSSWDQMIEVILEQVGVGIRQLNPYLRQLYLLSDDRSNIALITNNRNDLVYLPTNERVCFVITPDPSEVRRIWLFLDKFVNARNTYLQMVGRDILIVAQVGQIQELLKLYDFAISHAGTREYRVLPLIRVDAEEMAKVLDMIFAQFQETTKSIVKHAEPGKGPIIEDVQQPVENGLKVIPLAKLARAVFLIGTKEEIKKAEEIVREVEDRVALAREKVVHTYTVKHSNPEELADILSKIYSLMVQTGTGYDQPPDGEVPPAENVDIKRTDTRTNVDLNFSGPTRPPFYNDGGYFGEGQEINPPLAGVTTIKAPEANVGRNNFIVDLMTGNIVMVVEVDLLPRLTSILKKLDVPKKMVQIEVLFFEKRLTRDTNYGLKLLRTGDKASNTNSEAVAFNDLFPLPDKVFTLANTGLFQFCLSRERNSGFPAYDLAYNFLISQDDVQVNTMPSVLTLNQTPATIKIVEERSIRTATFTTPQTSGATTQETSFTRKQYGITIQVKPTIHDFGLDHANSNGQEVPYITLENILTFQNPPPGDSDDPNVPMREVTNSVIIPDGQTVIMGGLRRKTSTSGKDAIPYIGEIPGIGKLFSWNELKDEDTDMYIFITPKIIFDPVEDLKRVRWQQLCLRPGDIPEFMCRMERARERKRKEALQGTMTIIFGREPNRCMYMEREYDGRSFCR